MTFAISDIKRGRSSRADLLRLNNVNARETSLLTADGLGRLIDRARIATVIEPAIAMLIAFEHSDDFDGGHFRWFRGRLDTFLYVDRIITAVDYRRRGAGRLLYEDLFRRAEQLGHVNIACEVNIRPPNPTSDRFHASFGFEEVGTATFDEGARTVRYLVRR